MSFVVCYKSKKNEAPADPDIYYRCSLAPKSIGNYFWKTFKAIFVRKKDCCG